MRRTAAGSATIPGCTPRTGWRRRRRRSRTRAPSWSRWAATRSTRSGPTSPSRAGPGPPARSRARLIVHPDEYAGESSAAKRQHMADWLKEQKAEAAVLAALDSIAWTFNVRGKDVDRTPVALSFALVRDDGTADLFVASEKIGDDVRQHLGNGVRVHERRDFEPALKALAGKTVAVDPERSV